jgi:hypothetical protein
MTDDGDVNLLKKVETQLNVYLLTLLNFRGRVARKRFRGRLLTDGQVAMQGKLRLRGDRESGLKADGDLPQLCRPYLV